MLRFLMLRLALLDENRVSKPVATAGMIAAVWIATGTVHGTVLVLVVLRYSKWYLCPKHIKNDWIGAKILDLVILSDTVQV